MILLCYDLNISTSDIPKSIKISTQKNKYIQTIYGGGYRLIPQGIQSKKDD